MKRSNRHLRSGLSATLCRAVPAQTAPPQPQAQAVTTTATNGAKKVIGFEDYTRWRSLEGSRISGDGQWLPTVTAFQLARSETRAAHLPHRHAEGRDGAKCAATGVLGRLAVVAYFVDLRTRSEKAARRRQAGDARGAAAKSGYRRDGDLEGHAVVLVRARVGPLVDAPPPARRESQHKGRCHPARPSHGPRPLSGQRRRFAFNRKGELLAYTVDPQRRTTAVRLRHAERTRRAARR